MQNSNDKGCFLHYKKKAAHVVMWLMSTSILITLHHFQVEIYDRLDLQSGIFINQTAMQACMLLYLNMYLFRSFSLG